MSNILTAPIAALTTVFTHSCSQSWLLTTTRAPSQYPPFPTGGPASCEPPSWNDNIAAQGIRFYSPAICPSGFFVGPNCGVTKTRTQEGFAPVTSGETVAYCVPSDHTCTTDTSDFRGGVWGFASATAAGAQVTVAPAIQIRWRDSDLSFLQTHPLTPGLVLSGGFTTPQATRTPTTNPNGTPGRFTTLVPAPTLSPQDGTRSPTSLQQQPTSPLRSQPSSATSRPDTFATSRPPSSNDPGGGEDGSPFGTPLSGHRGYTTAIILGSTITGLAFLVIALFALQRYLRKRCRKPDDDHLTPIGVGVWARYGRNVGSWGIVLRRKSEKERVYHDEKRRQQQKQRDPEAGRVHIETVVEIDATPPLGSRTNPAELEARNNPRLSWMSRISDAMGGRRSGRATPRPGGSSSRSELRSNQQRTSSRWTSSIFVGRTSADWEAFTKERWPNGLSVPPQTYKKQQQKRSSGMNRSMSRRGPSPPSHHHTKDQFKGHSRNKSSQFRLSERSDGTFGELPRSPGFGFLPSPTTPTTPRDHLSSRSS